MTSSDSDITPPTATTETSEIKKPQLWPGNRPPVVNMRFLEQRMDATWGRGKFREEIWNDKVNPCNDWWLAFTPSQEEAEASNAGYDFSDPKGWCEVRL